MPSIDEIYHGKTLRAEDIPADRHALCIIEKVERRQFDEGEKLVLSFRGKQRVLILNRTNANRVAEIAGRDYTQWPGRAITLRRERTTFRGADTNCVRVVPREEAAVTPAATLPPAQPEPQTPPAAPFAPVADDEIPF